MNTNKPVHYQDGIDANSNDEKMNFGPNSNFGPIGPISELSENLEGQYKNSRI